VKKGTEKGDSPLFSSGHHHQFPSNHGLIDENRSKRKAGHLDWNASLIAPKGPRFSSNAGLFF
tara:strand:- start:801 stop:989 length:189 start_codon:yes stop_codon:yes gene_type:complete